MTEANNAVLQAKTLFFFLLCFFLLFISDPPKHATKLAKYGTQSRPENNRMRFKMRTLRVPLLTLLHHLRGLEHRDPRPEANRKSAICNSK